MPKPTPGLPYQGGPAYDDAAETSLEAKAKAEGKKRKMEWTGNKSRIGDNVTMVDVEAKGRPDTDVNAPTVSWSE